jgi:hypothetical protein
MKTSLSVAIAVLLVALQVPAEQGYDGDIIRKIISVPSPSAYRVDGLPFKPLVRTDRTVQGGKALRVDVPGKAPDSGAIAVTVSINKPDKAGDRLVLAIWARLEKGENGASFETLEYNSIQLTHAPYTALLSGPLQIGPEWKLQELNGISNGNYAAGDLKVSIHLASGKHVVDIGPVLVLDMGQ